MAQRDDFSTAVRSNLGRRANLICSNPTCRTLTGGPHSDPASATVTGRAAHIKAAAAGGPRFDAKQTAEERASIENAIYLCARCADVIDRDDSAYSVDELLRWKTTHEAWVERGGFEPEPPSLTVLTLPGLSQRPSRLNGGYVTTLLESRIREHRVSLVNLTVIDLLTVSIAFQLPEPATDVHVMHRPAGVEVLLPPTHASAFVQDGNGATPITSHPLTGLVNVEIEKLPAGEHVELLVCTYVGPGSERYERMIGREEASGPRLYFMHLTYSFRLQNAAVPRDLWVPLAFDRTSRSLKAEPAVVESDARGFQHILSAFF